MDKLQIELATLDDAEALLAIYAYYVEETAITFEYEVPTVQEFKNRMATTLERYPYLIAKKGQKIVGYAHASAFKGRAAYDYAVETTIYVDPNCKRMGLGKKLYTALEAALEQQGILNLYACIAYPAVEDQYLTKDSVSYHERLGYRLVGEFYQCGYKYNTWYNMVWMEKMIGEHQPNQEPLKRFADIQAQFKPNEFG
ncbi:acyltransferase [Enterococcus sp. JM4C]|uniref:GNAT family N-acetyltransferase n=1 Tax=Candidatus Enterococcus huntleyi TaxID=1857217 RepID=UPI00137AA47B|nr:GNAT family N-acetyltransferase [Enterococcus sp. JM4C]KAF1298061.1 acyltransferase [Enterococcus sp. JM4C]